MAPHHRNDVTDRAPSPPRSARILRLAAGALGCGSLLAGCGSAAQPSPSSSTGAPVYRQVPGLTALTLQPCRFFSQDRAAALFGEPVAPEASNGPHACGYDVGGDPGAGSLSVNTRPRRTGFDLRASAGSLGLSQEVPGVGDVAFTDGRITLIAEKGDVEIQTLVNPGRTKANPSTLLRAAAKSVADGI